MSERHNRFSEDARALSPVAEPVEAPKKTRRPDTATGPFDKLPPSPACAEPLRHRQAEASAGKPAFAATRIATASFGGQAGTAN